MARYKVSFIFDDTDAEFKIEAFLAVKLDNALDVGQVISGVKVEPLKSQNPYQEGGGKRCRQRQNFLAKR